MYAHLKTWQASHVHLDIATVNLPCNEADLPEVLLYEGRAFLRECHFFMNDDKMTAVYFEVRSATLRNRDLVSLKGRPI